MSVMSVKMQRIHGLRPASVATKCRQTSLDPGDQGSQTPARERGAHNRGKGVRSGQAR
jgi:hypothetical protein